VVIAKRAISAGEVLRTLDVEMKTPDKPLVNIAPAKTVEAVVGQESMRALAAGQPIDTSALRKPILIRRGDPVVVTAKAAGVRVSTTTKALAEGALGDLVPLEIAESREKLSAVVTGVRQAEVFASGATVTDSNQPTRSQLGDR
jgi:flagella basal body P-ring formation protein FlgA